MRHHFVLHATLAACLIVPIASAGWEWSYREFELEYGDAGATNACLTPDVEGITSTCLRLGREVERGWITVGDAGSRVDAHVYHLCFFDAEGMPVPYSEPFAFDGPCVTTNHYVGHDFEAYIPRGTASVSISALAGEGLLLYASYGSSS